MAGYHLLALVDLNDREKKKLESTFDSVSYYFPDPKGPRTVPPPSIPAEELEKADCVFGWALPEDVKTLEQIPKLRWQMTPSAGTDRLVQSPFWQEPDVRKQVTLTTNAGVHCSVIPPYCISMAITLFSRINRDLAQQVLHQKWQRQKGFYVREMQGSTWGILGYGRIGRETARLAKAFGCRVIAATSDGTAKPDPDCAEICPGFGDLDGSIPEKYFSSKDEEAFANFLGQTDVLVISVPLTPSTKNILDGQRLKQLKKDAILINIGRGGLVDTDALIESVESGHLHGAALDVTDPEPLPEGHKLWSVENIIITPHMAGLTERYLERSVDIACLNGERLKAGKPLMNVVDLQKAY